MSRIAFQICEQRRFGRASRKQVILFMADKASADGTGIWCSKRTIADFTGLGLSTVKRIVQEFLDEGLLKQSGHRICSKGRTVIYDIDLDQVQLLEPVRCSRNPADVMQRQVHSEPPDRSGADGRTGPRPPPNLNGTESKPPTGGILCDVRFDRFWNAYPSDKRRNADVCRKLLLDTLQTVCIEDIVRAAENYARLTGGYSRSKVSYSDNWLRAERWHTLRAPQKDAPFSGDEPAELVVVRIAGWIKTRSGLCRHITKPQLWAALDTGRVTEAEARAAGVLS